MDKIYPMSLRAQAHDIITTWAFYTIAKSYLHSNSIPWNNIMISGHGLDPKGDKMSKSKGNVVLPLDVVEKYSADAMRWWSSSAKLGEDLTYQEKDVATGQKILNKLWNSSLFVSMNLDAEVKKPKTLRTIDKWILSKLMGVIDRSTKEFEQYEYSRAKQNTELFFWREFCDNYIELIKHRLYGGKEKDSAQWTAYYCLLNIVKLFSPIIPHVTEEIYQEMFKKTEKDVSINLSKWPEVQKELVDKEAEECGDLAIKLLAALRQWKQQSNMALNAELKSVTIDCDKDIKKKLDPAIDDVKEAMKVKEIKFGKANTAIEGTSIKFDVSA
jgi:valyl-tRNA synthetase